MNKDFEKWILDGGNYPLIFTKMPSFVKEKVNIMNKDLCNWISRGGISTTHTLGNILIKDIIDISSIMYENCAISIDGKIEYIIEKHKFIPDRKQFSIQEGFYTIIDLGVKYSDIYTYRIYKQTLIMKKEERECDNNA